MAKQQTELRFYENVRRKAEGNAQHHWAMWKITRDEIKKLDRKIEQLKKEAGYEY